MVKQMDNLYIYIKKSPVYLVDSLFLISKMSGNVLSIFHPFETLHTVNYSKQ